MRTPTAFSAAVWCAFASAALAGSDDKKAVTPPVQDTWRFSLSLPGWAPAIEGTTGVGGITSHIDLSPYEVIRHVDMVADVRAEAHKGRWSVLGEFLYLSLTDGIGSNRIVKKVDVQLDQAMADFGVAYRLLESERGFVDVIAGVRYTNLYQKAVLQPNDRRIDQFAGRLALAGTVARGVVERELRDLRGDNPTVPIAPLEAGEARRLAAKLARVKGDTAERQERIVRLLHDALDHTSARLDDWWDPYIGLRARYLLHGPFYLAAKGDIGGFGVGSDLTWTAEAALGVQVTRSISTELGYRALGVDYRRDGLIMDTVTHGVQLTTGIAF